MDSIHSQLTGLLEPDSVTVERQADIAHDAMEALLLKTSVLQSSGWKRLG